ncbi:MAG: DUF2914 domain-containing protein [Proteobacteria bacterium]|nr:DUF2914 domain-containing protein [Pseudomonadota bacterium]
MKITIRKICSIGILALLFLDPGRVWTEEGSAPSEEPTLVKAVMCESIQKFAPVNEAVVFSIDLGRVFCFTAFDPVPKQTVVYHKWYHRGSRVTVKQFTINPPRWSSFSSMQLRDADKGPWQVDVVDNNDKVIRTLRFSITD